MTSPLLSTKFYPPSGQSTLVERVRLIEQLDQGRRSKLILISATAGSGKTTLLSEWLRQARMPTSWLSLDVADNDPSRFWIYVVTALQQFESKVGKSTLAMLRSPEPTSFEAFLIPLINEIADLQADCALVLDDYHIITAHPIHQALTFLMEHLPPQVHLAIASRADPPLPLARLRARGQLTELRAADLRFTYAEAAAFLNQSMQLPLSQEQVEAIQARTEGWITGLQLAALSMRDVKDIPTFIESFKGSQRYILDYLVEEVLEHQPQSLQSFLLRTSILERMCGSLCEAVMGADPSVDGTAVLEQLEHRNLFVVTLDHERQWYRYHHLFQELLRHYLHRVEPEQVPEYHRRAAQWYQQQGFMAEAVQHAITAQAFHWAADLIEQEVPATDHPPIESATLLRLLEALPHELVWNRPWLLLAYAWTLLSSSRFEAAVAAVQHLECLMQHQGQDSPSANTEKLWGLVIAFKGVQARHQGEASEAISLMEEALRLLSQDDSWLRPMILLNLGVTYFVADNFELAKPMLKEVTRIGQTKGIADPAIAGLYLQAQFQTLRGRMDQAITLCRQGFELAKERSWLSTYAGVLVQVAMGELLREQNQLTAAVQHLTESIERGTQIRQPGVMMGYITLARVRQAQGDIQAAWDAIRAAEQLPTWLWPTILSLEACKTRLYLAQGDLEAAIAWTEESALSVEDELRYSFTERHPHGSELDYLTLARVLIARGRLSEPYLDDAMQLLIRLHDFAKAGGRRAHVMEVLMLQALVWQARGDLERALSLLEQALDIPRTGDYIRLFVDEGQPMAELLRQAASRGTHPNYVSRLLAAFGLVEREVSAKAQPLIEPLSNRELEILCYLAMGLSNQAIADQLIVSLATVKWHARNIYSKLDVSNRTQAVTRARKLGILV